MQDQMIVALYWKRDESAISETDRKYRRYLSKIAYNILSDWEDSKETVNDTYLKAWNSMPTHKPRQREQEMLRKLEIIIKIKNCRRMSIMKCCSINTRIMHN